MADMNIESVETTSVPPVFAGVPASALADFLERGKRRSFSPGEIVIAEGDSPGAVFVVASGDAVAVVIDRDGLEHQVGHIGPGMTAGEMSVVTGEPAAATVRAATELTVLELRGRDFDELALACPQVYRNVGITLAERLAKTNRLVAELRKGRLVTIEDAGGPPELAWALACSAAWHTRRPTLLLVVDDSPADSLAALAEHHAEADPGCAAVRIVDGSRTSALQHELDEQLRTFDNVLVLTRDADSRALSAARRVVLADADEKSLSRGEADIVVAGWSRAVPRALGPAAGGVIRIPAPTAAAADELRRGTLAPGSCTGRAVGWLARDLVGLKVGLAFGAGGPHGYAHAGVLEVLARAGLEPDYVAGASVGSAVAILHGMGYSPSEIADELDRCGQVLFRPTLSRKGLLSNRALRRYLQSVAGDRRIENLPVPTALLAADLETEHEVVLARGPIWLATLASISIPGVFPAVRIGDRTLVDGGIINPVPTSTVAAMGAGALIGVRLGRPAGSALFEVDVADYTGSRPSAISVILRSIELMQAQIVTDPPELPLVTIVPEFGDRVSGRLRTFSTGRRYVEAGAAAAESALPRLATVFPWVRP